MPQRQRSPACARTSRPRSRPGARSRSAAAPPSLFCCLPTAAAPSASSSRCGRAHCVITLVSAAPQDLRRGQPRLTCSNPGHAAFPGGKADSLAETPLQIARREAYEEIGLPLDDGALPPPFRIEHICQLPFHLAKTEIVVRPCVAFLHSQPESPDAGASVGGANDGTGKAFDVEESLIPRLDAKEVAAVFSAPFHNFLRGEDESREGESIPGNKEEWYRGSWTERNDRPWLLHNFHVPVNNQVVTRARSHEAGHNTVTEPLDEGGEPRNPARYKVWGVTARILVDAARVAYGEEPTFEVRPILYTSPRLL